MTDVEKYGLFALVFVVVIVVRVTTTAAGE